MHRIRRQFQASVSGVLWCDFRVWVARAFGGFIVFYELGHVHVAWCACMPALRVYTMHTCIHVCVHAGYGVDTRPHTPINTYRYLVSRPNKLPGPDMATKANPHKTPRLASAPKAAMQASDLQKPTVASASKHLQNASNMRKRKSTFWAAVQMPTQPRLRAGCFEFCPDEHWPECSEPKTGSFSRAASHHWSFFTHFAQLCTSRDVGPLHNPVAEKASRAPGPSPRRLGFTAPSTATHGYSASAPQSEEDAAGHVLRVRVQEKHAREFCAVGAA